MKKWSHFLQTQIQRQEPRGIPLQICDVFLTEFYNMSTQKLKFKVLLIWLLPLLQVSFFVFYVGKDSCKK
jgi:hypothetical protein